MVQHELHGRVPLIGFAGAPFTLASYAIEGGHSNNFARTKSLMYGHPDAWHRLCDKFATVVADYLGAQIDAGVDAVQVFDSWVGTLSAADYREFALPHIRKKIFDAVAGRVPSIHFGTGTATISRRAPRGWRRRHRRRLARADRRGVGSRSASTGRCRATSIRRCCSGRRGGCSTRPKTS